MTRARLPVLLALLDISHALYAPVHEYAGKSFFDGWDFPGSIDNTTWGMSKSHALHCQLTRIGNVTFVDHATATSAQLAFVNTAGNAVLRVDNVSVVIANAQGLAYRNSVCRLHTECRRRVYDSHIGQNHHTGRIPSWKFDHR